MARSIENINSFIVSNLVTQMAAIGITINPTLWSKRNILRAICYTVAICQNLMEQLQDAYLVNVENIQATAAAASTLWLQDAMFKFQYSATNPQVLQLINVVPQYPVIDPTLRIISACSVKPSVSNQVKIKVAKGNPFIALSGPELSAAQSYINLKGAAGITYIVSSNNSDKIYINANIYYQGQYATVISANVIAAINAFFQNLSITNFDGSMKLSDLESVIRNVQGVNDVVFVNVKARQDSDAFTAGTYLVQSQQVISRLWASIAGYMVPETTAGSQLTDSLNFIAE
jgi:hypothetical protein